MPTTITQDDPCTSYARGRRKLWLADHDVRPEDTLTVTTSAYTFLDMEEDEHRNEWINVWLDRYALEVSGADPSVLIDAPPSAGRDVRLTLDDAEQLAAGLMAIVRRGRDAIAHSRGFSEGSEYGRACAANWLEWETAAGKSPAEIAAYIRRSDAGEDTSDGEAIRRAACLSNTRNGGSVRGTGRGVSSTCCQPERTGTAAATTSRST